MKKIISIVLAAAITIGIAGCGSSSDSANQSDTTLTIAWTMDKNIFNTNMKSEFELAYPHVKLDVLTYENYDSMDMFYQKIFSDTMVGRGPDMIFIGRNFCSQYDINKIMSGGGLADMASFIKDDTNFNSADYNKSALQFGILDNAKYIMPISYNLPLYLTTESAMQETGFDPDKCTNVNTLIDELVLAGAGNDIIGLGQSIHSTPMQYFDLTLGLNVLDYSTTQVHLDNRFRTGAQSVKKLGEYMGVDTYSIAGGSEGSDLRGKPVILDDMSDYSFGFLLKRMRELILCGEKPVIVPARDENGKLHGYMSAGCMIPKNSTNQQLAYEFVKIALSEKIQMGQSDWTVGMNEVPVNTTAMRKTLQGMTREIYVNYTDSIDTGTFVKTKLPGISADQAKQYEDIVSDLISIHAFSAGQAKIGSMLMEYYNGTQTYDQAIAELQNTMDIYISE